MSQKPTSPAIAFRPSARAAMPVAFLPMPPAAAVDAKVEMPAAVDLTGKKKAWFLVGRGRIGKTTFARWLTETTGQRDGSAIIAACDPVNRSLRQFLNNVAEPLSSDPIEVRDWLRDLLQFQMEEGLNSIIDLGGGNTSLSALLAEMPDLHQVLADGGVEPVALHVVGSDPHDVVPLAVTEAEGFQPPATAIICNEAHGRRIRFDQVLAQPEVRATLDRGAIQLWMPMLSPDAAKQCDANCWRYYDVRTKAGPFVASAVQTWLRRMGEAMQPITSWIPE
ncbi:MAG: hypothetical protein ACJ8AI_08680 [Rhodopila sp.]